MVFQWFPMVANHWSDDGMVTIHRSGLDNTRLSPPFRGVPPTQLHSTAPQREQHARIASAPGGRKGRLLIFGKGTCPRLLILARGAQDYKALREGVRSRYSLSPERRKNSWQLYFNPRHQYLITRVFLGPIAFRIYNTHMCKMYLTVEK